MATAVGYLHLLQRFKLKALPLLVESSVAPGAARINTLNGVERRSYPLSYFPGDEPQQHLEFALKREPLQLELLAAWFDGHRDEAERAVSALVRAKPTGEYARRAWFLYEWLTGRKLALPDGRPRSVVVLLDDATHVTREKSLRTRSKRHHVEDNLPGVRGLCPLVRRTPEVERWLNADFGARLQQTLAPFDAALLQRATDYLYKKETRSSFEIEGEPLSEARTERFVALLRAVLREPELTDEILLNWQRALVEPRFAADGYRTDQVYVGESGAVGRPGRIHYIAPKPEDVGGFMHALLYLNSLLWGVPPLVHATIVSFAFVFIHPYDDGNGRLHRLLIHHILHRRTLTPDDIVFPVSAVMLDDRRHYDRVLESFSRPLLQLLDYDVDEEERVAVRGDTALHYRYFDATPMVEGLGVWIDRTLTHDFPDELGWLTAYDKARASMRRIVDLPEKYARLLVQVLLNNSGKMSSAKRGRFPMLTDDEVQRLASVVREQLLPFARSR